MADLRIAVAVLIVCGVASPVAAQQKKPPKPPPPPKSQAHPAGGAGKPSAAVQRINENPAGELDRFTKMSPQEREKELSKLPPQRRAAFEQRLADYQRLTPEQQEKFRVKLELMQSLPKDRQNAVKQEIQRILALPGPQRRKVLNSEDFNQKFSPDEQTLIRDRFPNIPKPDQPAPTKD